MNIRRHLVYVFLVIAWATITCQSAKAQVGWSGEAEVGTGGRGDHFFSQYLFNDAKKWNLLARYFKSGDGGPHRGEFAFGPTVRYDSGFTQFQAGVTTNRDIMLASFTLVKVRKVKIAYVVDAKLPTRENFPTTVYQKMWVSLHHSGKLQARAEHIFINGQTGFLRLGLEFRIPTRRSDHVFIAPFYSPPVGFGRTHTFGFNAGYRFF